MENKKQGKKMYMLALKVRTVHKDLFSKKELDDFLEKYKKYYQKDKTHTIFANLVINDWSFNERILTKADELERLEPTERTLLEIDNMTTEFNNSKELRESFNNNSDVKQHIVIAYKNNGTYKTLPVMYKKHKYLLNYDTLKKVILELARVDDNFLNQINIYKPFNNDKSMYSYLEALAIEKERFDEFKRTETISNIQIERKELNKKTIDFIEAWCNPKNKNDKRNFSYRKQRDLVEFVIDSGSLDKIKDEQTSMFDGGNSFFKL